MTSLREVSQVRALSDEALISGLHGLLRCSRRTTAGVLAHLGEVEERRLHLHAGHGSMFAYCVSQLGMSEDEACRRIDVARLCRRFPVLLERLLAGELSLSVAALLKRHLTASNHAALFGAVSNMTIGQAREVLARWFPQADVAPSIRKLPARRSDTGALAATAAVFPAAQRVWLEAPRAAESDVNTFSDASPSGSSSGKARPSDPGPGNAHGVEHGSSVTGSAATNGALPPEPERAAAHSPIVDARGSALQAPPIDSAGGARNNAIGLPTRPSPARAIVPLAPERYRVQLTGGAELKRKLELARDLLRHAVPNGDLATIVERGLDLLLQQTMKRRFGVTTRAKRGEQANELPHPLATALAPPSPTTTSHPAAAAAAGTPAALGDQPASRGWNSPAGASPAAPATRAPTACLNPTAQTSPPIAAGSPASPAPVSESATTALSQRASSASPRRLPSRHVPSHVRRSVLARDEVRCSWRGPDGTRCESRAWLEHDHVTPHARGGDNRPANVRILCRAHNRLAAETAYGRGFITNAIARRRTSGTRPSSHSPEQRHPAELGGAIVP